MPPSDSLTDDLALPVLDAEGIVTSAAGPRQTTSLRSRRSPLIAPAAQLSILDAIPITRGPTRSGSFAGDLAASGYPALTPTPLEIFQINLGKLCNMTCRHCHVDSGPDRTDANMDRDMVEACIGAIDHLLSAPNSSLHTVDLTGGAPELNPHFEFLVDECIKRGLHVIDRCNLSILLVGRCRHLPDWMAQRGVEVACSLPHYRQLSTDAQRGEGAFMKSIEALKLLNAAGYGLGNPARVLTLVTNPAGAFMPGNQDSLQTEWKRALEANHGITFDRLFALVNLPMSRFLEWLLEKGQTEEYLQRLVGAFNPAAIDGLMCRNTISVGWDGRVFDCDFNQQLDMDAAVPFGHISDFDLHTWQARSVRTARHCYGCTAGAGSSCGGATT